MNCASLFAALHTPAERAAEERRQQARMTTLYKLDRLKGYRGGCPGVLPAVYILAGVEGSWEPSVAPLDPEI